MKRLRRQNDVGNGRFEASGFSPSFTIDHARRTCVAIELLHAERREDHYSELARHYLLSNDAAKAIRYTHLAAEQARDRAAYAEAVGLVDAGLHLLSKLPGGEGRLREELALRHVEIGLMFILYGASWPKRERSITRVCEIAEELGEKGQLLRGLVYLSSLYWARTEPRVGLVVIGRCLELREFASDPALLADVYWMAAVLSEGCGKLREAVGHYQSAAEAARDTAG